MPQPPVGPTHPLILARLQSQMRRELKVFRKITGLTAVTSLAATPPQAVSPVSLAPPVHPQCARRIRQLRITPCGDQWLAHVAKSRRSSRAHSHVCPIGLRCTCVPIHVVGHLVGVAKLVAPQTASRSAFDAAMGVLKIIVSEVSLDLTVSELTEQVHMLQERLDNFERTESRGDSIGANAWRRKNPPDANSAGNQSILLVDRTLSYLHSHYQNPTLSLGEVAEVLRCNARYLTTRFTKVVGEHMHTYLLALRVAHACRLLIGTDLRVKEIAHASGFASTGRLTSTFRRRVGVSPLEYRRVFSRTT